MGVIIIIAVSSILTIIAWRRGWRWRALYPLAASFGVRYVATWFDFVKALGGPIAIVLIVWLLYMVFARPKFYKEQREARELQKVLEKSTKQALEQLRRDYPLKRRNK